jgi:hypothetical protein
VPTAGSTLVNRLRRPRLVFSVAPLFLPPHASADTARSPGVVPWVRVEVLVASRVPRAPLIPLPRAPNTSPLSPRSHLVSPCLTPSRRACVAAQCQRSASNQRLSLLQQPPSATGRTKGLSRPCLLFLMSTSTPHSSSRLAFWAQRRCQTPWQTASELPELGLSYLLFETALSLRSVAVQTPPFIPLPLVLLPPRLLSQPLLLWVLCLQR